MGRVPSAPLDPTGRARPSRSRAGHACGLRGFGPTNARPRMRESRTSARPTPEDRRPPLLPRRRCISMVSPGVPWSRPSVCSLPALETIGLQALPRTRPRFRSLPGTTGPTAASPGTVSVPRPTGQVPSRPLTSPSIQHSDGDAARAVAFQARPRDAPRSRANPRAPRDLGHSATQPVTHPSTTRTWTSGRSARASA